MTYVLHFGAIQSALLEAMTQRKQLAERRERLTVDLAPEESLRLLRVAGRIENVSVDRHLFMHALAVVEQERSLTAHEVDSSGLRDFVDESILDYCGNVSRSQIKWKLEYKELQELFSDYDPYEKETSFAIDLNLGNYVSNLAKLLTESADDRRLSRICAFIQQWLDVYRSQKGGALFSDADAFHVVPTLWLTGKASVILRIYDANRAGRRKYSWT